MKITTEKIRSMKGREKIAMLTAYDYSTAKVVEQAGIEIVLVGDSLSMVMLGYDTTQKVTMEDMVRATEAVGRAIRDAHVVGDLPYGSYGSEGDALRNARRLLAAGADSVKVENEAAIARFLVSHDIAVMGHVGLTPQTITRFKVQGKDEVTARRVREEALALEQAGCYAIVLECVPVGFAAEITGSLSIPTIGIGAGPACDGQVLVIHDLLGLFTDFKPKFVKRYAALAETMRQAIGQYRDEVKAGAFPDEEHSYH